MNGHECDNGVDDKMIKLKMNTLEMQIKTRRNEIISLWLWRSMTRPFTRRRTFSASVLLIFFLFSRLSVCVIKIEIFHFFNTI